MAGGRARQAAPSLLTRIFNTPASKSVPARLLAAVLVGYAAKSQLAKKKHKKRAGGAKKKDAMAGGATATAAVEGAVGAAGDTAERTRKPDFISMVWKTLWPKLGARGKAGVGSLEMLLMLVNNLLRVYIANRLADNVRIGDELLFTRDVVAWRRYAKTAMALAIANTGFRGANQLLKDSLARKWRAKLTDGLCDEYFNSSNFYHVEQTVQDVDVRLTTDVQKLSLGFADFYAQGTFTATTGVFYTAKVFWEFGALYASVPFIYMTFASQLQPLLGKMNWSLFRKLEGAKAALRNGYTRLVQHSEAVAALKGTDAEQTRLQRLLGDVIAAQRKVSAALLPYNASTALCYRHLVRTVYCVFVIGPGTFRAGDDDVTIEEMAAIRGDVGYQFILFIQTMTSVGQVVKTFEGYKRLAGNAARFIELRDALIAVDDREEATKQKHITVGASIKFNNVTVKTPTQRVLCRDLSFEVGRNDSMLLTGHNGAGKSSLFRCLAGLWPIEHGSIQKPGSGAGLRGTVFYLPQKPYNVLGTLVDQLTYPELGSTSDDISEAQVRSILAEVDLEYLADRPGVFTEEVNWEEECSLGEKQRLAIARLIWHKPKFAILDECTSAVSTKTEEQLYWMLNAKGVTYITISHRPVLRAFHRKLLRINGDAEKTYLYEELQSAEQLAAHAASGQQSDAATKTMRASDNSAAAKLVQKRSEPFRFVTEQRHARKASFAARFNSIGSLGRFFKLLRQSLPRGGPAYFLKLTSLVGVRLWMADLMLKETNLFFRALFKRDTGLLFKTIAFSVVRSMGQTAVEAFQSHVERGLEVDLQKGLTTALQRKAFENNNFYNLQHVDGRVSDLDNRISDEVASFSETVSTLWSQLAWPLLRVAWFSRQFAATVNAKVFGPAALHARVHTRLPRLASHVPN